MFTNIKHAKLLLLIGLWSMVCGLWSVSSADKLTSADGNYTLFDVINSGGMKLESTDGNYILLDSKGEFLGGKMTSGDGNYTFIPGLFGLVGGGTWEPLSIRRNGTDIEVTWEVTKALDIYILTGDGTGVFTNEAAKWVKVCSGDTKLVNSIGNTDTSSGNLSIVTVNVDPKEKKLVHAQQVGDGSAEVYYRGLRAGASISGTEGVKLFTSAEAVGKVNLKLVGGTDALISTPFLSFGDDSFENVIGNQLDGTGAVIYSFIDGYKPAYVENGTWQGALKQFGFDPKRGYWIVKSTAKTLTLVGQVTGENMSIGIAGGKDNMVGSPYPVPVTFDNSGLKSVLTGPTDMVYGFVDGYKPAYLENGTWQGSLVGIKLQPKLGYWILKRSSGDVSWNYPKPY